MGYFDTITSVNVKTRFDQVLNNAGGYVFAVDEA